jgi:heat-inducible transcriptional repressor
MAALEDEGYITQPHTSAGRVPTDLGYRMFVDQLSTVKPLTSAERRAIQSFLEDAVDLDDVMARTVRLLSQVTREVALVQYPTLSRSSVRHVEVVSLSTTRILVVLIADTGRVDQRMLDTAAPIDETIVADVRARIALVIGGRRFIEVPDLLVGFVESFDIHDRAFVTAVAAIVMELAVEKSDQRVR